MRRPGPPHPPLVRSGGKDPRTLLAVDLPLPPLQARHVADRNARPARITLIGSSRAADAHAVVSLREEAWFGPHRSVLVDLVEAPLLRSLHARLLCELEAAVDGLELLLPCHTRAAHRPHRSATSAPRPAHGDVLEAARIALAELEPPGRPGIGVVLVARDLTGAGS